MKHLTNAVLAQRLAGVVSILLAGCRGGDGSPAPAPSASSALACTPGAREPCYEGPPATRGVGACRDGQRTCKADGAGLGPCEGEVRPRFDDCATPEDEDCDGAPATCTNATRWTRRIPTATEGRITAIAFGPKGEPHVAGIFSGPMDLGGGRTLADTSEPARHDGFVARLGDDGALDDLVHLEGPRDQTVYAMKVDRRGNSIVAGSYFQSVAIGGVNVLEDRPALNDTGFVISIDPAGKPRWAHRLPDVSLSLVRGIALDANDAVWVAGSAGGRTSWTVYVARLDASGRPTFTWQPRGSYSEAMDIAVDGRGNAVVIGTFSFALAIGGAPILRAGKHQTFVVKLDPGGRVLWSLALGPQTSVEHVAVDAADRIWVSGGITSRTPWAGRTLDPRDGSGVLWVLDADGRPLFEKQHSGSSFYSRVDTYLIPTWKYGNPLPGVWENGTLLAFDPANNAQIVATFERSYHVGDRRFTSNEARDVVLFKLDGRDGKLLSARAIGGDAGQLAHAAAVDARGRVYVGGAHVDKPHAFVMSADP